MCCNDVLRVCAHCRYDIANKIEEIVNDIASNRLPKALSIFTDIIVQSDPTMDPQVKGHLMIVANAGAAWCC